jgi:SAM-dependent methyltransferase
MQASATLDMLSSYPQATVLDVGGGHAQVTGALLARGYRVTVFGSAQCCGRRLEPFLRAGACTFESVNLLDLPYPDHAYDVVVSYRLLAHTVHWRTLLRELGRVAHRAVLIDVPVRRSLNGLAPWLFGLKKRVEGNTRSFRLFDEPTVLDVAASVGLVKDGRYAQFFLPMVLHRMLKAPRLSSVSERLFRTIGATDRFGSPVILKLARREG